MRYMIQTPGLTDAEKLEMCRLLVKAGYKVSIEKSKQGNRTIKTVFYEETKNENI